MYKITGLDKLQRDLKEVTRALDSMSGRIAELHFDPGDARSVANAIREMERAVDRKVAPYRSNTMIQKIASAMKDSYRTQINERANKARRLA
jgi:Mg2+ and Co2+ transporter CorA